MAITKMDAARRQIDAAIRMTFRSEDLLAIYSLGSAGCQIVRDVHMEREKINRRDLLERIEDVKAMADGEEKERAALQIGHRRDGEYRPHSHTVANVAASAQAEGFNGTSFWKELNLIYGFLKHARKGEQEVLAVEPPESHVDDMIMFAVLAFLEMEFTPSVEMKVFHDWRLASLIRYEQCRFLQVPKNLHIWERKEQLQWCLERIEMAHEVALFPKERR